MSLSRSPSPLPNGGWSSKSLTSRGSTPNGLYAAVDGYTNGDNHWAAAKARSAQVRGYPSIQTKNEGFFQRSKRRISTLPVFNSPYTPLSANWKDPEKLGRSRWTPRGGSSISKLKTFLGNVLRKFKFLFIILSIVTVTTVLMSQISMCFHMPGLPAFSLLTVNRSPGSLSQQLSTRWWQQIRHRPWSQRRWRCHGMEGSPRMGH